MMHEPIPMRLVYVVPFFPYPPSDGGSIRVWHTLRALAARNEVHLVVQGDRPSDELVAPVQALARSLTFVPPRARARHGRLVASRWAALVDALRYPPSFLRRYRSAELVDRVAALIAAHDVDWLLCDTQLSGQLALSRHLPPVRRALCLYDVYEIYFRRKVALAPWRPYKLRLALEWLKARHYERRIVRRFDLVGVVSPRERRIMSAQVPPLTPVVLTPNGVDTEYFQPYGGVEGGAWGIPGSIEGVADAARVLFVGNLAYEPNDDGLRYFLDQIWPLVRARAPSVRFTVVGKDPPAWLREAAGRDDALTVTGAVDDVRPYYDSARVAVVPLRLGAGTKLKVLEALAMRVPVVATPEGRAGIDAQDGRHLLVGATPEQFARHVATILGDRALAARLRAAGRAFVEPRYGWPAIMAVFEQALREELPARRGVTRSGAPRCRAAHEEHEDAFS